MKVVKTSMRKPHGLCIIFHLKSIVQYTLTFCQTTNEQCPMVNVYCPYSNKQWPMSKFPCPMSLIITVTVTQTWNKL